MLAFPNCKINLGLRILDKRKDGFHNIESIFLPVKWCDVIEAVESETFEFISEGRTIEGKPESNSCVKAYYILKDKFKLPEIKISLLKNIPAGAGLGGGSADGAFMLMLLNEKFALNISDDELKGYAAQLGSDCTFFINNDVAFVTGRGEVMEKISLSLNEYFIVIVYPLVSINTSWAYSELVKQRNAGKRLSEYTYSLKEQIQFPVDEWNKFLKNDFEEIVFAHKPEIKQAKERLIQQGAVYASMSGSGSSVFGIFNKQIDKQQVINHYGNNNVFFGNIQT